MSFSQRECALAEWEVERAKRKDKLEVLQTQISLSRRNSDISQRSALKNLGETDSNNAQGYRNRYNLFNWKKILDQTGAIMPQGLNFESVISD